MLTAPNLGASTTLLPPSDSVSRQTNGIEADEWFNVLKVEQILRMPLFQVTARMSQMSLRRLATDSAGFCC